MDAIEETLQTVEHLQQVLENLLVRGLRSAGTQDFTTLHHLRSEFDRVGAHHLAGRIGTLHDAMRNDDRAAAAALLRTQASLRVFERIMTLESAQAALAQFVQGVGDEPE